jgi:uncharacterized membrane protein YhhN
MVILLLLLALGIAALEWFFEYQENQKGIYFTKPAVMIFLIAWAWLYVNMPALMLRYDTASMMWFIVGLVFSLAGDVFLMLPDKFFLPGLIAFLLTHVFYTVGFEHLLPPEGSELAAGGIAVILIAVAAWLYSRLAAGMEKSGKAKMRFPVLIYTIVIMLMVYTALLSLFDPRWAMLPAVLVSVGAVLFLLSDILNGWVRFVGPIREHRILIMITYHLGQFGIIIGAALHFTAILNG